MVNNAVADSSPPALTGATVTSSGDAIELAFGEDLDLPATIPAALKDAFSVTADGDTVEISGLAADGSSGLQIALWSRILKDQAVVVSYDRSAAGTNALDDAAGNEVVDFTTGASGVPAVDNDSTIDPPTLSSALVAIAGDRIILDFSENLDTSAAAKPPASAFSVSADGASIVVGSVAISSGQKTRVRLLSLDRLIYQGQTVTVTYTDPTSGDDASAIQDAAGNDAVSFTTGRDGIPAVVNNSTEATPTCTLNTGDIWCGTLTVGTGTAPAGTFYGYSAISGWGSLSPNSFMYDGVTITVGALQYLAGAGGDLRFGYSGNLGAGSFVLHVGSQSFSFMGGETAHEWLDHGLSWSVGDTVDVRLREADAPDLTAPTAPTALMATAFGATAIDLAWTAPDNNGGSAITGYKIEVSEDGSTGSWTDLEDDTESTNTDYRHSGLSGGDTRHYRVSAINAAGTSPASAPDSATAGTAAHHAVPATIHGTVLWSAEMTVGTTNIGPGYEIGPPENGLLSASTFNLGGILTVESIIFIPGRQNLLISFSAPLGLGLFTFHVGPHKAEWSPLTHQTSNTFSNFSNPGWSHDDTVDVRLVQATAPGTPTGLTATASGTQIDLAWTAPASDGGRAVTGYRIEVSEDGSAGSWSNRVANTRNDDTSYSHTGLAVGDTRHYRVSAINAAGTSGPSDPAPATVTGTQSSDATLSGLTVTGGGSDLVTFVSGTTTYTAMVASTVTEVTVTATKNDTGATIDYLDGDDAKLDDADTGVDGLQVTLAEGENVIKVKVTAADTITTQTYTVTVTWAAAAPTITDVAVTSTPQAATDTYGEGETIEVTVTFSEAVTATTGTDFVLSVGGAKRAPLVRGSGTATLVFGYTVLAADEDDNGIWIGDQDRTLVGNRNGDPQNGTIASEATDVEADLTHAARGQQSGHKVDGSLSAVEPDEPPEVTLHLGDADGEVEEDAGAVMVTATVSPASATAFTVTVSASPVAPATDEDFELSTNRALRFAANATASSGTVTIAPVDDDVAESNRVVTVSGSASIEGVTGPGDVTLTILEDDLVSISGICNRTVYVRGRILELLKHRHSFEGRCGDVNETHLVQLKSLDLGRNPSTDSAFTISLRSGDFEGLVNLERLSLRDTRLRSLPAGVFDGLAALETLELDRNRLRSLPAGVFADLHSLKTLELQKNPSLSSLPYDEFEALPNLTNLRIDQVGRHKLQVAGGEGEVTLEVAAGDSVTYPVRLMAAPDFRITADNPLTIEVSSDTAGVVATPAALRFTKENWFRRQTVTVVVVFSASGTAELAHDASGTTTDSEGNEQSNYDFEAYPLPTATVLVLESGAGRSDDPLKARFVSPPEHHDGSGRVKVRVAFSEAIEESPENVGEHGVKVEGGRVTSVRQVDNRPGGGAAGRSSGGQEDGERVWEFEIEPGSDDDLTMRIEGGRPCDEPGAICTEDGRSLSEGIATTVEGPDPVPLTAAFEGLPEAHDGEEAFHFRMAFSEEIGIGFRSMRDDAFTVDGGAVTGARRVDRRHDLWRITVEPDGEGDVTVTLAAGRECAVSGAICTRDGDRRQLANTPAATVAGPAVEPVVVPLTASFVEAPHEHDGKTAFKLRIAFSEDISIGFRRFRDQALSVSGGSVKKAKRVDGRHDLWEVTVKPGSLGDVRVTLAGGRACGTAGAVCTGDGRALSATISTTVLGPVALSVADARVREASDVTLDFAVTLSRASRAPVAVAYATADGSATAGSDYTATSGTLTFAAGETAKTVSVPVLDDAHDEGEETLTLRLSAATGAVIADGVATGTIENTDLIPAAWLARFGRTVTDQVLEAVEARLTAPRTAGARATLAGQALPSWDGANDTAKAAAGDNADASDREAMTAIRDWMAHAGADGEWRAPGEGPERADLVQSRALTGRDFLTGTSFALTGGSAEVGGYAALWGRGAISRFDGREGDLTLDGEVTTGLMGADWAAERWTAGLAIGHARGTGGYSEGGGCTAGAGDNGASGCSGEVEATLTGVWPYAGLTLTERLSAWAAAGYGAGSLTLTPGGESPFTADLTMAMGAAGMRGEVLTPPPDGGLALALKGDARFTRTASEATKDAAGVGNLAAASADVWLVRTGIEGSRRFAPGGAAAGLVLTPSFEIGVRLDGGDAETGLGVDLGGGLAFAAPKQGIALDLKARGLVAHQASGFREWGASASLAWDPRPSTDRGLALTLRQSWGGSPTGGMDALLGRETLAGLAANDNGDTTASTGRLEAELGYGIAMFDGGFTGTPHLGVGLSETGRDYRLGWRLTSARRGGPGFEINLDATRSEAANDDAEHGIALRGVIRW